MTFVVMLTNMKLYDYGKIAEKQNRDEDWRIDTSSCSVLFTLLEIGAIWCLSIM